MKSNVGFMLNNWKIGPLVVSEAKKRKQVIYGARAMNKQVPTLFGRQTSDYDIYARNPKSSANNMQRILDRRVAKGQNEFYSKPALHKGTHKVMHIGQDLRKGTVDDVGIVDYTNMPKRLKTKVVNGIRYESISSIRQNKLKILKDKESRYRHQKDREDLERIKNYNRFRRI